MGRTARKRKIKKKRYNEDKIEEMFALGRVLKKL
jgi:hypothetical protein